MSFRDELRDVIKKKALGFSYTEETIECETSRSKPFVLCENENRLYLRNGYIMVEKILKNGEICAIMCKKVEKFASLEKILKKFKGFKLKGL